MVLENELGLLWDIYTFGKFSHRVISPLNCDAHGVYLKLVEAGYSENIEVYLVSSDNDYIGTKDSRDKAFEAVRKELCKLQKYSFLPNGKYSVIAQKDSCGNWIDFDDAHCLFDPVVVDYIISKE